MTGRTQRTVVQQSKATRMTDYEKYIIILHYFMLVASRLSRSCQATKVATVGDISKLFDENFPKLPLKTVEAIG